MNASLNLSAMLTSAFTNRLLVLLCDHPVAYRFNFQSTANNHLTANQPASQHMHLTPLADARNSSISSLNFICFPQKPKQRGTTLFAPY